MWLRYVRGGDLDIFLAKYVVFGQPQGKSFAFSILILNLNIREFDPFILVHTWQSSLSFSAFVGEHFFIFLYLEYIFSWYKERKTFEQFENIFQKGYKTDFWFRKWAKRPSQEIKIWPTILLLEVWYQPFEPNIHPMGVLWRPQTMPKQLLNNSKTPFKKSKKRVFWLRKWSNWPSKKTNIWPKTLSFWRSYINLWSRKLPQNCCF